jgi:hypothetical protein
MRKYCQGFESECWTACLLRGQPMELLKAAEAKKFDDKN